MIFIQLKQQLESLSNLIKELTDSQYSHRISHLGNASIGGHARHIIELLECAITGFETGLIDYVNRKRNLDLQSNRMLACGTISAIIKDINSSDKLLEMLVETDDEFQKNTVSTTYYREIVYNTEHTIHHLALIKVALIEMQLSLVDDNFGMAYSTIKYNLAKQKQLTQVLSN
jgi:hypothetical protein